MSRKSTVRKIPLEILQAGLERQINVQTKIFCPFCAKSNPDGKRIFVVCRSIPEDDDLGTPATNIISMKDWASSEIPPNASPRKICRLWRDTAMDSLKNHFNELLNHSPKKK